MRFLCRCGNMLTNQLDLTIQSIMCTLIVNGLNLKKRGGYIF